MDEQPSEGREQAEEPGVAGSPAMPDRADGADVDDPEARRLAMEAAEIRRLVEAGADSPEALRELAARLREHRAREEALWRAEVKPVLKKEGKGRIRGYTPPARSIEAAPDGSGSSSVWLWFLLAGLVVVVALAASTTIWILVLPIAGLLVWAWRQGRDSTS